MNLQPPFLSISAHDIVAVPQVGVSQKAASQSAKKDKISASAEGNHESNRCADSVNEIDTIFGTTKLKDSERLVSQQERTVLGRGVEMPMPSLSSAERWP